MLRRWAETWVQARPEIEAIRRREIREADNVKVLALLEGAFNHAIRSLPPRPSSGMAEMQKYLSKLPAMNGLFEAAHTGFGHEDTFRRGGRSGNRHFSGGASL